MNNPVNYNQQIYRILYYRYKHFLVPVVTILISIVTFFMLVIPQFDEVQSTQNDLTQKKDHVRVLDDNIKLLNGIDESTLTDEVQTETTALPPEKDFAGMLSAVTNAASPANVKLSDFGFTVGNLSTESAKLSSQLAIQMDLQVDGGIDGARRYIKELSHRFPLNEIITEQTNDKTSTIQVSFFYRPFQTDTSDGTSPLQPISSTTARQVNTLKTWINDASAEVTPSVASSSASK